MFFQAREGSSCQGSSKVNPDPVETCENFKGSVAALERVLIDANHHSLEDLVRNSNCWVDAGPRDWSSCANARKQAQNDEETTWHLVIEGAVNDREDNKNENECSDHLNNENSEPLVTETSTQVVRYRFLRRTEDVDLCPNRSKFIIFLEENEDDEAAEAGPDSLRDHDHD